MWKQVALLAATGPLLASPAAAHAPPQATSIQWLPGEAGERALVRTNRGFIIEDQASGAFRIVCNDAFEVSLSEVPPVVVEADGRVLLGSYAGGLMLSSPDLCGYEPMAGAFEGFYPIVVSAAPDGVVYTAALPYDGSSAALLQTTDGGRTGELLTELPGAPTALLVAPSDSARIYVSVTTAEDNLSFGSLLTSADAGRTFDHHPIELQASELRAFLLAVAPNDPELSFVRAQSRDGLTPERLLRSEDGGKTFEAVLSIPGPISALVRDDGVVWAGGAEGLYRSDDHGRSFVLVEDADLSRIGCLATRGRALYVCGYSSGEFGVQVSVNGSSSFEWFLRFPRVTARLDCPQSSDEGERCGDAFADWAMEQGTPEPKPPGGEAGAPTTTDGAGGAPTEPTSPTPLDGKSGCHFLPEAPARGRAALLGAAFAAALWRSRRRTARAPFSGGK